MLRTNLAFAVHGLLVKVPGVRKYHRRLVRTAKKYFGIPDAYGELISIAKICGAEAVLDVGSYVGDTIQLFLDELSIPIHGFEPTPHSFRHLEQRFKAVPRVKLYNIALSRGDGFVDFFENRNPQTNSLLDNDSASSGSFYNAMAHLEKISVQTLSLDSWLEKHGVKGKLVVKADVQGAEELLLAGGRNIFNNNIIAFYTEVQIEKMYENQIDFCKLHEILSCRFGFVLRHVFPCLHDAEGRATQFDCLWVKLDVLKEPFRG